MALRPEITNWLISRVNDEPINDLKLLRQAVDNDIIAQQGAHRDSYSQGTFFVVMEDGAQREVRTYVPYGMERQQNRPAIVFAHGGGWCLGSLPAWDRACRLLAESTKHIVFSVDYRLAPEFKFPTPLRDYFTAIRFIYNNAQQLGVSKLQISVAGDSAGANLAAAACLMARKRSDLHIRHQLLFYPALDALMEGDSYQQYGEGYDLTANTMAYCWENYLGDSSERKNELANPLMASTLTGVPPATILVCEYDPVRSDGELYKTRLLEAGIPVNFIMLEGMLHGAIHMMDVSEAAIEIYQKIEL
ncbi:TPA: alpha/beta hydrolase [Providencia rettgeri]